MALLLVLTLVALDGILRAARRSRAAAPDWSSAPGTPLSAL